MGPTDPTDPTEEPVKGPLSGILVADFSRILAGPYATMMLGDLGAQVIKVESPAGDDTREWVPPRRDGVGTYYLGVNRNKRSIALDLSDAHDQAVAHALAQRADVFIQNFRPGGLARFGLDYESVARRNPAVIYCSISGFGAGQGAKLPGYDVLVQGVSGLTSLTGAPDTPPFRSGISVFDVFTGLHSAVGILAALHHRDVTGQGQHIETNLLSTALSAMVNQTSAYVAGGVVPHRMGNSHLSLFPYEPLATGDGDLIIAAGNDRQFRSSPRRSARRNWPTTSVSAASAPQRQPRGTAAAAAGAAGRQSAQEWFGILTDAGIPCGPINDVRRGRAGREPRPGTGGDDGRRADRPQPDPHVRDAAPARTAPAGPERRRRRHPRLARLRLPEGIHRHDHVTQPGEPVPPDRHGQPLPSFPTSLGTSEGSTITLLGQDLARDLDGPRQLRRARRAADYLRRPTPQQSRLFEAVLLGLADHGFTPTAIAARLTHPSAPTPSRGAGDPGMGAPPSSAVN